jgi:hypothetical protein
MLVYCGPLDTKFLEIVACTAIAHHGVIVCISRERSAPLTVMNARTLGFYGEHLSSFEPVIENFSSLTFASKYEACNQKHEQI